MIETIDSADLHCPRRAAADSPRRRAHLNAHNALDAAVQRLFIALEPDTYRMCPHRHPETERRETSALLAGALDVLSRDEGRAVPGSILRGAWR